MTTCHLANISIRLGRKIKWDPKKEQVIGDKEANKWQSRKQRKGLRNDGLRSPSLSRFYLNLDTKS